MLYQVVPISGDYCRKSQIYTKVKKGPVIPRPLYKCLPSSRISKSHFTSSGNSRALYDVTQGVDCFPEEDDSGYDSGELPSHYLPSLISANVVLIATLRSLEEFVLELLRGISVLIPALIALSFFNPLAKHISILLISDVSLFTWIKYTSCVYFTIHYYDIII